MNARTVGFRKTLLAVVSSLAAGVASAHTSGFGGHFSGGHVGGHVSAAPAHGGGFHGYAGAAHFSAPGAYHAIGPGYSHWAGPGYSHWGGYGHAGGWGGRYWGGWNGSRYWGWHGGYWGGGWWGGAFWPAAIYGAGFAWYLATLPAYYNTYWYDGMPYYYANSLYYTWNPDYSGYVVTDPPPAAQNGGATAAGAIAGAAPGAAAPPPQAQAQAPIANGGFDQQRLFAYPKNGQSDAQQAQDRQDCTQWAGTQTTAGAGSDYRRAMSACLEGRGYSVR